MHQPRARVVGGEGNGEPAAGGQDGAVATRGVVEVELGGRGRRVEDARAVAEDVEVVPVQMHGVGNRNLGARCLLDDPVGPNAGSWQLDQVVRMRVACVLVHDVLNRWLLPVDVDCCHVDTPEHNVLLVGGHVRDSQVHAQVLDLAHEGCARDDVGDDRRRERLFTSARLSRACARRVARRCSLVLEDGLAVEGAGSVAAWGRVGVEPVVACGLVGSDDDVVALS